MAIEHDRLISASPATPSEEVVERALRPRQLAEYVGQPKVKEQLEIFIAAARNRGEALDHLLLFGPPGLGKTTLAHIIAAEMGVTLRQTSGPVLERPGDLAALLTNLEKNDVLFIDEIHRLSPVVEEILYPALEDFQIDIMIGEGPAARSIKLDLAAVHAGRRHHPRRHAHQSAARPLRHRAAARVLRRRGPDADRAALGASCSRRETAPEGAREIAAPRARHAAHRQPAAAPGARLRRGQGRRPDHQRRRRCGAVDARCRPRRPRRHGPQAAAGGDGEVLRRPGRAGQPGRGDRRGARHHRGRDRALPDPAGTPAAHAARTHRHRLRLYPLRPARAHRRRAAATSGRWRTRPAP